MISEKNCENIFSHDKYSEDLKYKPDLEKFLLLEK